MLINRDVQAMDEKKVFPSALKKQSISVSSSSNAIDQYVKMHFLCDVRIYFFLMVCSGGVWSTNNVDKDTTDDLMRTQTTVMAEALKKCDIQCAMREMANVLSHLTVKATAEDYLFAFRWIFALEKIKSTSASEKNHFHLEVSLEKALFIFEILVNGTAEEALARIKDYENSTFFKRDHRDVFLVGVNFQRGVDTTRVVYTWVVNLYSASGTLIKSFPRESRNILYLRNQTYSSGNVVVRREPVRDHYDILEEVGRGRHVKVYKCVEKRSGLIFAARFVRIWLDFQRQLVYNEINIMSELSQPKSHPNLLALHEAFDNDAEIIMIVDFVDGKVSDLYPFPTPSKVSDCIRQVCEGLKHMHSRNIAHNDVRFSNVGYVTKDNAQVIKLLDFGVAQKIGQIRLLYVHNENELHFHDYNTPEKLENRTLGAYTDMWHVGVLTFYLLTEDYPNWGWHCRDIDGNIKACKWGFSKYQKELLPDEALDFISRFFVKDVEKRMTADECLNHPWISRVTDE